MFGWILDVFRTPNANRIAKVSLDSACVELLQAEHCLEYYQAVVPMLQMRVARLENYSNEPDTTGAVVRLHGPETKRR